MKTATATQAGVIARDELYLATEFCKRMRWQRKSFRVARDRGLPVRKVGRNLYVDGSEAIDWFKSLEKLGEV